MTLIPRTGQKDDSIPLWQLYDDMDQGEDQPLGSKTSISPLEGLSLSSLRSAAETTENPPSYYQPAPPEYRPPSPSFLSSSQSTYSSPLSRATTPSDSMSLTLRSDADEMSLSSVTSLPDEDPCYKEACSILKNSKEVEFVKSLLSKKREIDELIATKTKEFEAIEETACEEGYSEEKIDQILQGMYQNTTQIKNKITDFINDYLRTYQEISGSLELGGFLADSFTFAPQFVSLLRFLDFTQFHYQQMGDEEGQFEIDLCNDWDEEMARFGQQQAKIIDKQTLTPQEMFDLLITKAKLEHTLSFIKHFANENIEDIDEIRKVLQDHLDQLNKDWLRLPPLKAVSTDKNSLKDQILARFFVIKQKIAERTSLLEKKLKELNDLGQKSSSQEIWWQMRLLSQECSTLFQQAQESLLEKDEFMMEHLIHFSPDSWKLTVVQIEPFYKTLCELGGQLQKINQPLSIQSNSGLVRDQIVASFITQKEKIQETITLLHKKIYQLSHLQKNIDSEIGQIHFRTLSKECESLFDKIERSLLEKDRLINENLIYLSSGILSFMNLQIEPQYRRLILLKKSYSEISQKSPTQRQETDPILLEASQIILEFAHARNEYVEFGFTKERLALLQQKEMQLKNLIRKVKTAPQNENTAALLTKLQTRFQELIQIRKQIPTLRFKEECLELRSRIRIIRDRICIHREVADDVTNPQTIKERITEVELMVQTQWKKITRSDQWVTLIDPKAVQQEMLLIEDELIKAKADLTQAFEKRLKSIEQRTPLSAMDISEKTPSERLTSPQANEPKQATSIPLFLIKKWDEMFNKALSNNSLDEMGALKRDIELFNQKSTEKFSFFAPFKKYAKNLEPHAKEVMYQLTHQYRTLIKPLITTRADKLEANAWLEPMRGKPQAPSSSPLSKG